MVELRKLKGGKEAKIYPTGVHKKAVCPKAKITFIGQGGLKSILSKVKDDQHWKHLPLLPGAARAGVENLTRSLAVEWAEEGVLLPFFSFASLLQNYNFSCNCFTLILR